MDTLKPCNQVSNKQLDEMNEQIEQLRDVIGMLSTDLDDLKANLVVDKGTISNLSSDTINTNDLYVNNKAEIKNAIISYIEKNHQYFNTMENHLDFGSFTNEADLDIILRAEADEQIIKIHIAENMAVSYSNAKSICNNIKLYKKDNKLYLSGNNLKPGKEVLVLIYAASDEFVINQPVPVDAVLLGEAKVSSKFDIQSVDRPEWNNKSLALLADVVSGGVTKNYKGVLETEDELPKNDNKQGDLYIIKLTKKGYVGEAVFDGLAWVVQSFYELQFYFNKDEVNALIEAETNRAVTEETRLGETIATNAEASTKAVNDIIDGTTPVRVIAKGATSGGRTLALTDDALMLYGPQGMDNIPESTSLDDLKTCGQFAADTDLAATLTDKPEEGAFDLIVGYSLADKNNPYQVYVNKANGHTYRRGSDAGYYDAWTQFATVQLAFDAAHPVGEVITQYPGMENPNTLYNKNGVTSSWMDITDTVDQDFIKFRTDVEAGTAEEAGLPNIKGYLHFGNPGQMPLNIIENASNSYEASTRYDPLDNQVQYSAIGKNTHDRLAYDDLTFDASRSSPIYGASTTVTPKNKSAKLWKRTA